MDARSHSSQIFSSHEYYEVVNFHVVETRKSNLIPNQPMMAGNFGWKVEPQQRQEAQQLSGRRSAQGCERIA
jgi:hypothetical protein